jgi:hypothetical protein
MPEMTKVCNLKLSTKDGVTFGSTFRHTSCVINRVLSSFIVCGKVQMDAYLKGDVSESHSVSTEAIQLRNDVMYFSDTWCSWLNSASLSNTQCSGLTNTGNFPPKINFISDQSSYNKLPLSRSF